MLPLYWLGSYRAKAGFNTLPYNNRHFYPQADLESGQLTA